mgnify:CR=1 FL=1
MQGSKTSDDRLVGEPTSAPVCYSRLVGWVRLVVG